MSPPPSGDPVAALAACHEKIRTFTAGLARMAALADLDDPRVPAAAVQARRYFAQGLPLHAQDEDLSFGPRLRAAVPAGGPLLDDLARDHREIDAILASLLPMLGLLAEQGHVPPALFRATAGALADVLLPHIAREEAELFPLCAALSTEELRAISREISARRSS